LDNKIGINISKSISTYQMKTELIQTNSGGLR